LKLTKLNSNVGRTMAQAISSWPITAEARVRVHASKCGTYGKQSGTVTGFSPISSVFTCQYYSTVTPYSCIVM
jgi:hypothetical protein